MEIIISTFFMSLLVVQVLQFLLQCNKLLIYWLGPGRGDYSKSFHIAPPTTRILTTDQRGLYKLSNMSIPIKPRRVHRPIGHTMRHTWPKLLLSPGLHFECLVSVSI